MILGHQHVLKELDRNVPKVFMLKGLNGIGKRTLAAFVADKLGISKSHRYDYTILNSHSIELLTRLREINLWGDSGFAVLNLDSADDSSLDDLLVFLENPPEAFTIVLIGSKSVPKTIESRSVVFNMGLLSPEDLFTILIDKMKIPEPTAKYLSYLGTVECAMSVYLNLAGKSAALSLLKAVELGNEELFRQACKSVDKSTSKMIMKAIVEASSSSWRVFQAEELGRFADKNLARKILQTWSQYDSDIEYSYRLVFEPLVGKVK